MKSRKITNAASVSPWSGDLYAELARRIEELEKKNPTVRLDEAFSMRAEEERQAKAANDGKGKRNKQKSRRRGRISTDEKLAKATLEEDVWPKPFKFKECQWRSSRSLWRILNDQAVLVAYHRHPSHDLTHRCSARLTHGLNEEMAVRLQCEVHLKRPQESVL